MGGAGAVLERAVVDYAAGEYRWVAEVLGRLVFVDPDNRAARYLLAGISLAELIDAMAVRLDGEAAADEDIRLNIRLTEGAQPWVLQVRNGVLHGFPGRIDDDPSATLEIAEQDLKLMLTGLIGAPGLIAENRLQLEGNPLTLIRFAGLFDEFDPNFNIVAP